MKILANVMLALFLGYLSVYDIKYLKIKNNHLYLLISLVLINTALNYNKIFIKLLISIIVIIIFLVLGSIFPGNIGGGDVKVIILLTLIFGRNIILIIFFATFLAIIFMLIFKKNKIPFLPFLFAGIIICQILKIYLIQ